MSLRALQFRCVAGQPHEIGSLISNWIVRFSVNLLSVLLLLPMLLLVRAYAFLCAKKSEAGVTALVAVWQYSARGGADKNMS